MTLYGYARVSVREPEDKNLDLQVERLVRADCSMGNVRAEEASGAKDDRGATRIPCIVQVGHHYSAPVAQLLGAIDTQMVPQQVN